MPGQSKLTISLEDWQAFCEFLDQQRWRTCPSRLVPERFKMLVVPETLDQRRAVGLVRWRGAGQHRYGWATIDGWRERLFALMQIRNKKPG